MQRKDPRLALLFQSAPANKGGRNISGLIESQQKQLFQSAPANKGGRNRKSGRLPPRGGCFNPHPPIKAGEITPINAMSGYIRFQSAPANKGGRNLLIAGVLFALGVGFNPHPPIKAGEMGWGRCSSQYSLVSIRTRQ